MWTHLYDIIVKVGTLFLSLFILTNIQFISDNNVLLPVLAIIITVFAYIFYLRTLSSLLYCKFTLGININFKEAKRLNPALSPNPFSLNGYTWLPLKEIKNLDNNIKYETALRLMDNWLKNKTHKMTNASKIKILEYSVAVVFLILLVTSQFDLPPSSYFVSIYCNAFNTDKYSPLLITALASLIYALPVYFIKKKIAEKKE
jgi:hypothetical protein